MEEKFNIVKSKAMIFIHYFKKNGEKLELVNTVTEKIKGRDFNLSIREKYLKNEMPKITYVNKKPTDFQLGTIYIMHIPRQSDRIYIYQLLED